MILQRKIDTEVVTTYQVLYARRATLLSLNSWALECMYLEGRGKPPEREEFLVCYVTISH